MGSLRLPQDGIVCLDASCLIYSLEEVKPFDAILLPLWRSAGRGRVRAFSSELSFLECLVKPLKDRKEHLVELYLELLLGSDELQLVPIDLRILDRAAHVRAETGLKTPDAIHAATALETGAVAFLTNDPEFHRVEKLPVLLLSELQGD